MVVNIELEIKKVLQKTNRVISWERLVQFDAGGEDQVQHVDRTAIAEYSMGTDQFRYFITQTLLQCTNKRTKLWQYIWSITFCLFREGAGLVKGKVLIVYFHVNKKGSVLLSFGFMESVSINSAVIQFGTTYATGTQLTNSWLFVVLRLFHSKMTCAREAGQRNLCSQDVEAR